MQVQRTFGVLSHDYEDGMDTKLSLMSSKGMETRYYEGCGREGPIRCIFLGEFHPVAGPKISCQFPEDYISKEVFDSISAYIIPKPIIQKCTMTINALGHKIVGYPIRIDNSRYERNVYVFNLCFVCDSWSKTVQYEPVVKKLGEHLTIMEEETRFVSSGSSKLPTLLAHLLHDLNTHRKATIVDDSLWTTEDYEDEMEDREALRNIDRGYTAFVRKVRSSTNNIRKQSRRIKQKLKNLRKKQSFGKIKKRSYRSPLRSHSSKSLLSSSRSQARSPSPSSDSSQDSPRSRSTVATSSNTERTSEEGGSRQKSPSQRPSESPTLQIFEPTTPTPPSRKLETPPPSKLCGRTKNKA